MKKTSNLSQLFIYAGRYRYLTIVSWVFSAMSALLALVPFWYIWQILREVLEVAPNFTAAQNLAHYGWLAVLFAVLSLLVYIGALMCSHLSAFRIATNIRIAAMHHIVTLPLGFMTEFGSGKMRKIVNESSAATETYLAHQLPDKAGAIATPCGLVVLLFLFDWRLGMLSLIPVVLAFFIMMTMTGASMQQKMKEYQNALDNMSNEAVEYVRGIPVVKTFGQTVFSFKRFQEAIQNYETWVVAYTKQLRLPMLFYTTAINSVFAFLIAAGLYFSQSIITTEFLLHLLFYIIITPIISLTLTKIMFASENGMIVADALARINSVMALRPLPETCWPVQLQGASVTLEHVTFSYEEGKETLHDISLQVDAGETIALVGPSGGGKTTLASLIARFFDVQNGCVKVGGIDVREIPRTKLMDTVAFVFQNNHLLKTSILENIRLARSDASREEVLQALHAAQCQDIIDKLPQGIDTVIGTKGVYLSGGEQQRIAIARVLLKNAPIIILDEATAFADPDNENKVQQAFAQLAKGRTVIMIAHRLSTIVKADNIYVVKDGKIVEKGSHEILTQQNGLYAKMWQDYQMAAQWKVGKEV